MEVEEELTKLTPERATLLTIGVFDGIHLGHQHLLGHLRHQAAQRDLLSVVVTFQRHPQMVLSPQTRLPHLTDLEGRTALLKGLGIELIVTLPFTHELADLSAHEFIGLLQKHLRMQGLVIGPDFALGRAREGDAATLNAMGKGLHFSVEVVPPVVMDGEVVSSTAIRGALLEGDMPKVHKLLGRNFSLKGRIIPGVERGRVLGFPTANMDIDPEQALPADGVYTTLAYIGDEARPAVTNIGTRPTFGGISWIMKATCTGMSFKSSW
jgi:riboflavin kinase/FMN adenylyltransferase